MDHKDKLTTEHVCPFLGLRLDRDTRYGFANEGNHCHRERSPRSINLDYQAGVCLTSGYLNCPIYLHSGAPVTAGATKTLSKVIPAGRTNDNHSHRTNSTTSRADATPWPMLEELETAPAASASGSLFSYTWFRLLFGLLLVVGSISGMLLLLQAADSGAAGNGSGLATSTPFGGVVPVLPTETPTPTLEPTPTHTLLPTGTPPLTATPSLTPTPSPTVTPTGSLTPTPTNTLQFFFWTNTPLPTSTPTNTKTPTPTPSLTVIPPTKTPVPPTNTPIPPTNTPLPPTITPTDTPISDIPTDTPTP